MKNILLFLLLFTTIIMLSGEAQGQASSLGTFRVEECVDVIQSCANCSYNNITSILYPNSTTALSQVAMTKTGTLYNYTYCNTRTPGTYIVNGLGNPDGTEEIFVYDFVINPLGKTLTESQARLYSLIFIISFIFFTLCFCLGLYLPSGNKKDEISGYVLAVSNLKYLKMFLICISYLVFMLMVYFGYTICYAYLDMDFLGSLFYFLFYTLVVLIFPLFVVGVFVVIANRVRDSKLAYELSRGFKIR